MAQYFTNAGLNRLLTLLSGDGPFFLGVGNSPAGINPSFTDLQGASKYRVLMTAGFPSVAGNTITVKATLPEDEANFELLEWGIFDSEVGGDMLMRVPEDNGVKLTGQLWIFESAVTLT